MRRKRKLVVLGLTFLVGGVIVIVFFDPDRRVIGRMNREPFFQGRAASAWRGDLRRADGPESARALQALVAGKGDAVPICSWVLRNATEPEARWRAADALAQMKKDAAPAKADLVAALSDPDPLVRGVAVRAVGELAPDAPGGVPALVNLLPDVEAIRSISRFGTDGAEAVPALLTLLKNDDPTVRWQAARALGKIRGPALPSLGELLRLTESDPDPLVREHAAEAIGDIGPAAAAGIPALAKALKDPVAKVRRDAVRSLGQIGPAAKGVIADVRAATRDPDENVRTAATRAVRLIDPTAGDKK